MQFFLQDDLLWKSFLFGKAQCMARALRACSIFMNTLCCIFDGRNSVGSFYIFYLLVSLTSMRFNYMQSF